ncbi:hypothetical protein [Desulfoluna spongiiphila]|uniref:Uncharacterized protein n=1 Tax=Desulfoluna spongiiphila TaxID=419481 RepID=A0A1G5G354_9BACT|nr:hypothetical protein [Desulfoluna spongiiphila]SCY45158.1 hypothetical protein SAMN05216233_109133 [Desulfoluna spongiiphila]VVS95332.1 hypothetical protein DBB_49090 [Desulfoluna spongiiphila]
MTKRKIERIDTPINLAAVREFAPEATTARDGIRKLALEGRAAYTITRLINVYGGVISDDQVKEYLTSIGINVTKALVRDYDKLCTGCGYREKDGHFLCRVCSRKNSDAPGQMVNLGKGHG